MKRRQFIAVVGGAAAAWPLVVRGQQQSVPVIGYLSPGSQADSVDFVASFLRGLGDGGYVQGRNIAIEYRWGENRLERLPALAADLVQHRVAAIFTPGKVGAPAAKAATSTIPIVFQMGEDPVKEGIVARLDHPGGNISGFSNFTNGLFSKRLGLVRDIAPGAELFAFLVNPNNPNADPDTKDVQAAVSTAGARLEVLSAGSERELETAFAAMAQKRVGGLIVGVDPGFLQTRRGLIAALAIRHAIPAIYNVRAFPAAGGLMSYGTDQLAPYRQGGLYVARILKGEKPGDLPVQLPSKFELVINLGTAKALGLAISPGVLAAADEVIE
jgi:putative tryptophan/tyrosine transport system substrate-binding protein